MAMRTTPEVVHLRQTDQSDNGNIDMIANYLIAAATLAIFTTSALAEDMELYCEGRHNDGAGAPVIQTHLWLKLTEGDGRYVIELQGPVFGKSSLLVEESPTEYKTTQFTGDRSVEHHIVLNRQTLRISYSVRSRPEIDHAFSGICSRYSPKI